MNLFDAVERFSDQESCIKHLEAVRWGEHPQCPHCESDHVAPKREHGRTGRWNCHLCKSSFNVLSGTLFQGTKIPLQKWFVAIILLANAKKESFSSCQLARYLGLNQGSTWFMMQRIRKAITRKEDRLLRDIIKTDETYVSDKPRRQKNDNGKLPPPSKRRKDVKKKTNFQPTDHKIESKEQLEIQF